MKALRPRTFLNLVVLGMVAVSLPLGVGLWTTLSYIDRVTGAGLEVVDHGVSGTRDSEILSESLRSEERTLRLYSVTDEDEYLDQTIQFHQSTDTILYKLLGLPLEPQVRNDLEEMRSARNLQRTILISLQDGTVQGSEKVAIQDGIESFGNQHEQARKIRAGFKDMMQREIAELQKTNREAQKALVSQTIAFILATIVIIVVMVFLLSWPIHQLNRSVERLGDGDFKTPIMVSGPLDMESVGDKLDWLRERLDALEQEKAKFLAHISHELKTPLASIREGASLLSEGLVGELNEKQRDVTSIMVNNSVVLQGLIENIISYNMAQVGDRSTKKTSINLQELIEKVVHDQMARIIGREITLDIQLVPVIVYGDRSELETVFENLFSNAVKFCPAGGFVGCRLSSNRKTVACIVYDNGPGIEPADAEKIFQPFYQVGAEAQSVVRGSGLGLAIVREYLSHHEGSIKLLNPGEPGARFGVTLPLMDKQAGRQVTDHEV
jgi:two-component system sensor histidine kinase GlrK